MVTVRVIGGHTVVVDSRREKDEREIEAIARNTSGIIPHNGVTRCGDMSGTHRVKRLKIEPDRI